MGRKAQPLQFAGRQSGRGAFERQIAESQVLQGGYPLLEVGDDALCREALFRRPGIAAHTARDGLGEQRHQFAHG